MLRKFALLVFFLFAVGLADYLVNDGRNVRELLNSSHCGLMDSLNLRKLF